MASQRSRCIKRSTLRLSDSKRRYQRAGKPTYRDYTPIVARRSPWIILIAVSALWLPSSALARGGYNGHLPKPYSPPKRDWVASLTE